MAPLIPCIHFTRVFSRERAWPSSRPCSAGRPQPCTQPRAGFAWVILGLQIDSSEFPPWMGSDIFLVDHRGEIDPQTLVLGIAFLQGCISAPVAALPPAIAASLGRREWGSRGLGEQWGSRGAGGAMGHLPDGGACRGSAPSAASLHPAQPGYSCFLA